MDFGSWKSDEGLRAGDTRMKNDTAGLQSKSKRDMRRAAAAQVTRGILSLHGLRIPMIYVPRFI